MIDALVVKLDSAILRTEQLYGLGYDTLLTNSLEELLRLRGLVLDHWPLTREERSTFPLAAGLCTLRVPFPAYVAKLAQIEGELTKDTGGHGLLVPGQTLEIGKVSGGEFTLSQHDAVSISKVVASSDETEGASTLC